MLFGCFFLFVTLICFEWLIGRLVVETCVSFGAFPFESVDAEMEKPRNERFVLILPIVHEIVSVARLNKRKKGEFRIPFSAIPCQTI